MGFCHHRARSTLERTARAAAPSLSLDLYDQWVSPWNGNGQWRFTPPTHVHRLRFDQALEPSTRPRVVSQVAGRATDRELRGYLWRECATLGFRHPVTRCPAGADHRDLSHAGRSERSTSTFYDRLNAEAGYVIYPGKLTVADSFRIGCIGRSWAPPRWKARSPPSSRQPRGHGCDKRNAGLPPEAGQENGLSDRRRKPTNYTVPDPGTRHSDN